MENVKWELENLPWYTHEIINSENVAQELIEKWTKEHHCLLIAKDKVDNDQNDKFTDSHAKYMVRSSNQYNILWYIEHEGKYFWEWSQGRSWEDICQLAFYTKYRGKEGIPLLLDEITRIYRNKDLTEEVKTLLHDQSVEVSAKLQEILNSHITATASSS